MRVADVLAKKPIAGVVATTPEQSLYSLVQRLREHRIGALVVLDSTGHVAGVISERDVVRGLAEDGTGCLDAPVSKYMTRKVVTATPNDDLVSVLERMTAGRFRHMPVLDGRELVGVVSIGDVVKYRIEMLQRENQSLEEFIRS